MLRFVAAITVIVLLIGAPLTGIYLSERPADALLEFPPMTTESPRAQPPFSFTVFVFIVLAILAVVLPFVVKVIRNQGKTHSLIDKPRNFPGWGWAGAALLSAGWVLAWTRFSWFGPFQIHTFLPLWLGYIILANALTFMRSGRSLLTHLPVYFLALFAGSALFWWYFEYLNLMTENWYYRNLGHMDRHQYFWYATLPFATVLPAVMSTKKLLETFPGFIAGLDAFVKMPLPGLRQAAIPLMLLAATALAATAIWPWSLYPMLWLAPLVIVGAGFVVAGKSTLFAGISAGNWKQPYLWGMAALVCGFFWELWNTNSLAGWSYAIPFVDRYHLFEMPAAGYAGYLPFGLLCGLVCGLIKDILPDRWL